MSRQWNLVPRAAVVLAVWTAGLVPAIQPANAQAGGAPAAALPGTGLPLPKAMLDQRTFVGDRPQNALVQPMRKYQFVKWGPYSRLVNDVLTARPKTIFVKGYIDPEGQYVGSSYYRGAQHSTVLGGWTMHFYTRMVSNFTNFYVFNTTNQVHSRTFLDGYFNRRPIYAPAFYRTGAATGRGAYRGPLGDLPKLADYYGRGEKALGPYARGQASTLETSPPPIQERTPGTVYFTTRGYGTYFRAYYRKPPPNVYREPLTHLITSEIQKRRNLGQPVVVSP